MEIEEFMLSLPEALSGLPEIAAAIRSSLEHEAEEERAHALAFA